MQLIGANLVRNKSIFAQCYIFIPPKYVRKPLVFCCFSGGLEMEHRAKMAEGQFISCKPILC